MRKPLELRRHLETAIPGLQQDPQQLSMFIARGSIKATATKALSWQYSYRLRLCFQDWAQHADVVMAPLIAWLKFHQNELLANPDRDGIQFQAEYLDSGAMDLVIDLDLTESVIARPREGVPQGLDLIHRTDFPALYVGKPERWTVFIEGQQVAQWDYVADTPLDPLQVGRHV